MKRLLALDGGGIRGVFTARILVELERQLGPLAKAFDLVAGTSTGGILACGIGSGVPAQALLDLYAKRGAEIFSRSPEWVAETLDGVTGPKYPAHPIEGILRDVLGDAQLASVPNRILVPTYATELPRAARQSDVPEAGSYFFKSWTGPNAYLHDVARCTSAAPTYFPPHRFTNLAGEAGCYTDGGTFADSPGMCAYAEAMRLWPGEELSLIAIGTGTREEAFAVDDAGLITWARSLPGIFMDGQCDTVDYQLQQILGERYWRLDIGLGDASSAMDDASPENVAKLVGRAEALLADRAVVAKLNNLVTHPAL